jgi:hypothetical protein
MNIFRPMQIYTVLTQDTRAIFVNQLLTFHAFRKAYSAGIKIFCDLPSDLKSLIYEKAWLK